MGFSGVSYALHKALFFFGGVTLGWKKLPQRSNTGCLEVLSVEMNKLPKILG